MYTDDPRRYRRHYSEGIVPCPITLFTQRLPVSSSLVCSVLVRAAPVAWGCVRSVARWVARLISSFRFDAASGLERPGLQLFQGTKRALSLESLCGSDAGSQPESSAPHTSEHDHNSAGVLMYFEFG